MKKTSTPPPISNLVKPNPPSPEAVARAAFVDKTYVFKGQANARL